MQSREVFFSSLFSSAPSVQMATFWIATSLSLCAITTGTAFAAINIPFTINLSENVVVTGTPRIAIDVGGNPRFANYTSGTGTNALTFTLSPTIGDVDLDGVTVSSPIDLNGGTIKDSAGNEATLTFTPPNTAGIKINYPSLGMDFTNGATGRYTLNGTVYNDLSSFLTASGGTFARNSIATYFDSTGTLQTASANVPRFDYDPVTHVAKGILIEESRTNYVSNSTMTGAVAGTIGSGGALPPNWNRSPCTGLSYQVIGTGTTYNLPYIDVGISGTNSSGTICYSHIYMQYTLIPVTPGEKFTLSAYTQLLSGTFNPSTMGNLNLGFQEFNSTNTYLTGTTGGSTLSSTFTKQSVTATVNNAAATQARMMMNFAVTNGTSMNITVRIAAPQLEKGTFPTSYIPTTTTSVTRAADTFTLTSAPWSSTSGREAVFAQMDAQIPQSSWASIFNPGLFFSGNRYLLLGSNGTISGGYSGANITTSATASSLTSFKAGTSFTSTNTYTALNGSVTTGPLVGSSSPATTGIGVGDVKYLNGHLQILKYYPLPLSDTQLQLLTQ